MRLSYLVYFTILDNSDAIPKKRCLEIPHMSSDADFEASSRRRRGKLKGFRDVLPEIAYERQTEFETQSDISNITYIPYGNGKLVCNFT